MKITKQQLKQIIKEELERLNEVEAAESTWQTDPKMKTRLDKIREAWKKQVPGITDDNLNAIIASLDPLVKNHPRGAAAALNDYLANMGVPEEAAAPTGPGTQ